MNARQLVSIFLLMLSELLCVGLHAQTVVDAPRFDPYLPGELNERALYALQSKDISTALILLERAYRLNPLSPDIKANLELVRSIANTDTPIDVKGDVIHLDVLGNSLDRKLSQDIPPLWPEPKP